MKTKNLSVLLSMAGAAIVTLAAERAQASYVCYMSFDAHPTAFNKFTGEQWNYGSYGQLEVTMYSGPGCTGTYAGYYSFCTAGITSNTYNYCDPSYSYTSTQILSLFDNLQRASASSQSISIARDPALICPYGGRAVTFYGK